MCLGTACLGQRQKWKDTNIRGKKKEKENKTKQKKGCSCSISNPLSPEWESYKKASSHKTPGQEVWKSDPRICILPATKIPKVLEEQSSGTCRGAHQQPKQAPRAAPPFLPLHFHGFVCTSEPPHPSQESSFWPRWLFPCHSSSFWEKEPAAPVHRAAQGLWQSWGRAAQDNSPAVSWERGDLAAHHGWQDRGTAPNHPPLVFLQQQERF